MTHAGLGGSLALATWLLCALCALPALRAQATPVLGSLEIKVVLSGSLPSPLPEAVAMDAEICNMQSKFTETFAGDNHGGLGNVVALLEPEHPLPAPSRAETVMNQKECVFVPHILVVPQGGTVRFVNSDPVPHDIWLKATRNPSFNQVIGPNSLLRTKLMQAEIIPVECDRHSWMKAWVFVTKSPYSQVSDLHGNLNFKDLPAEKYTLVLWQEALGVKRIALQVEPGRVSRLNVVWTMSRKALRR